MASTKTGSAPVMDWTVGFPPGGSLTAAFDAATLHRLADGLGLLGMACVVAAYFAMEKGYFSNLQLRYYVVNLVGALLLILSLMVNFNLGSFVIELFWVAISLMGIARCLRRRKA